MSYFSIEGIDISNKKVNLSQFITKKISAAGFKSFPDMRHNNTIIPFITKNDRGDIEAGTIILLSVNDKSSTPYFCFPHNKYDNFCLNISDVMLVEGLKDTGNEKIKRAELLPERKEKLAKINITVSDEELLEMNDLQFHTFLNEKTTEFLAEKERLLEEQRLKEEEEKAEKERQEKLKKEEEEKEKQRQKEIDEAKLKAEKDAREKAEKEKEEAILKEKKEKEEAIRAEKEASLRREQAIRDEQEARERARIQRELEEKMAKEKAEAEERARQETINKDKKWKEFLVKSGWTKEKENDFYILQNGNTRTIYKKIGEITI